VPWVNDSPSKATIELTWVNETDFGPSIGWQDRIVLDHDLSVLKTRECGHERLNEDCVSHAVYRAAIVKLEFIISSEVGEDNIGDIQFASDS